MPAPANNKYAVGNEGGRPTKLTLELLEKAKGYLDTCQDEYEQYIKQANQEKGYEMYGERLKVRLPGVAGLARWLNVSRDTIYAWREENEEFSDIVEDIASEQEKRLLDQGLAGLYNPTIAKLVLSKHGYHDKSETDITSKGEKIENPGTQYILNFEKQLRNKINAGEIQPTSLDNQE
jgi:hypothetical protein